MIINILNIYIIILIVIRNIICQNIEGFHEK